MINLAISTECTTIACHHTVRLYPNEAVSGLYQGTCGGCETAYECLALSPDELAWHDAQVAEAVAPKAAAKK